MKQFVAGGGPGARENSALSCAIAYDTRHQSRHFAELCAEVMVACGFKVYFLDGFRSTPELSFAVRHTHASCGIMVTASHNPPSDNAVKAYWSTGGQLLPPHDQGVIDRVMSCTTITRTPFAHGLANGQIVMCQKEVDAAYVDAVLRQSWPGPRELKIVYSPLHGVGAAPFYPSWRPTVLTTSSCLALTPNRTAIFRTCRAMFPIPKTPRCSTSSSNGPGR